MKIIFLLHNHRFAFTLDIKQVMNREKYKLYLIVNQNGYDKLKSREQVSLVDELFLLDDFSFDKLKPIIDDVVQKKSFDTDKIEFNIVTYVDKAVSVCGKLRKHYGIDDRDFENYHNKLAMKAAMLSSEIKIPAHIKLDKIKYEDKKEDYLRELSKKIPFPAFVKPINEAGSFGTQKITSLPEFKVWAASAFKLDYTYEMDEYIDGTLYHCDSFIQAGKILHTQVCEDIYPCYEFLCGKPEGSVPLLSDSKLSKDLCEFTQKIINKLGPIKAGVTHLEVFRKKNGELVFLEIAPRTAGAMIPQMFQRYLGIGLHETHINLQIDPEYKFQLKNGPFTAWVSYPIKPGKIIKLNQPELKCANTITWKVKEGDELKQAQRLADEACGILFWDEDYNKVLKDFDYLRTFEPYCLEVDSILRQETQLSSNKMTLLNQSYNSSSTLQKEKNNEKTCIIC